MVAGVTLLALLLSLVVGAAAGWWLARRRGAVSLAPGVGPHLLPDPALDWLRRSHEALGVWVAELDPREEGPRAERIVDAERLGVAQIVAVDRRLERARDQDQSGVERMESGILVFHAAAGAAVASCFRSRPMPRASRWPRTTSSGCSTAYGVGRRSSSSRRPRPTRPLPSRRAASVSVWRISSSARSTHRCSSRRACSLTPWCAIHALPTFACG